LVGSIAIQIDSNAVGGGSGNNNAQRPNVIVVGGSSGMGKAAADEVLKHGGRVLLVSRSMDKLQKAKDELSRNLHGDGCDDVRRRIDLASVDVTDEDQVSALASSAVVQDSRWSGLVVTAAGRAAHGSVESLLTMDARNLLESKLWGAYHCAKHLGPKLAAAAAAKANDEDGSISSSAIVFCAGILNRRPGLNCAPLAMANGALEGLTRTLALEMGPYIRVNCLSPGFCDTERFDHLDATRKQQMLENTAASLPLQKVGQPQDMGKAIYYLLTAPFCTGVILDVDGGHGIRQYANPQKDPMRQQKQQ
jgi:NAD(P)-dependent dehydrogenase (short-subunit alcohol dehydrogenase family)